MKRLLSRIFVPILIVAAGGVVAATLSNFAPKAEREIPEPKVVAVEVVKVEAATTKARVRATGVVAPAQQITLVPEVTGRVRWQSKALMPGGRFKKGEVVARIDSRDYQLTIEQERSRVQQSQVELKLEQGRREVAQHEWQLLGGGRDAQEATLALRKPQLAAAQSHLAAAQSGLRRAQLNLSRTVIRAPFNAMVLSENVDVGQVVSPGNPVATLYGTDRFWVKVSVPLEKLEVLKIPGVNATEGSAAYVVQTLANGKQVRRTGRLQRLVGELDPQTRTAQLVVAVENPMDSQNGGMPLLPGSFVEVELEGKPLERSYVVPRVALSEGSRVWVVNENNKINRRQVTIGWRERKSVVVVAGLSAGEQVVTSPIASPVEGMAVVPLTTTTAAGLNAKKTTATQ